ncbi:hypothetical protein STRTUCAR8_09971 [Streptomyces turgidiscabies Car8]|uniref:Uncharacterized protein n=1 Tax=Streptomyces turgidiscabies (strain Car8) TaxID=698760 RepID=L7F962_STRT8|nr:hypothetical protein STRTUCAR8_09971 [Streptomyces turgidiscabies Car8]
MPRPDGTSGSARQSNPQTWSIYRTVHVPSNRSALKLGPTPYGSQRWRPYSISAGLDAARPVTTGRERRRDFPTGSGATDRRRTRGKSAGLARPRRPAGEQNAS